MYSIAIIFGSVTINIFFTLGALEVDIGHKMWILDVFGIILVKQYEVELNF